MNVSGNHFQARSREVESAIFERHLKALAEKVAKMTADKVAERMGHRSAPSEQRKVNYSVSENRGIWVAETIAEATAEKVAERMNDLFPSSEEKRSTKRQREEPSWVVTDNPKRRKIEPLPTAKMSELIEECLKASCSLMEEKSELKMEDKWLQIIPPEVSCFLISDDQKMPGREFRFIFDQDEGKMITKKGDSYVGEGKDNRLHGCGRLTFHTGVVYEGGFKDGLFHGPGKFTFPNGDVYQGRFNQGIRIDNGSLTFFSNGRVYQGLFAGLYHPELVDIS